MRYFLKLIALPFLLTSMDSNAQTSSDLVAIRSELKDQLTSKIALLTVDLKNSHAYFKNAINTFYYQTYRSCRATHKTVPVCRRLALDATTSLHSQRDKVLVPLQNQISDLKLVKRNLIYKKQLTFKLSDVQNIESPTYSLDQNLLFQIRGQIQLDRFDACYRVELVGTATTTPQSIAWKSIPNGCIPRFKYYVAKDHPLASNSNPGTFELPLRDIQEAVNRAVPGDSIAILPGTYREDVRIMKSGTLGARIRLRGADGVKIKGSDVVTGWEPHEGKIWKRTGWKWNSLNLFVDDKMQQQIGGEIWDYIMLYWLGRVGNSIKDMVPGSFYLDLGSTYPGPPSNGTLYLWLENGSNPNEHFVEVPNREHLMWVDGNYITIDNIQMSQGGTLGYNNWPAVIFTGKANHFLNSSVNYTDFAGMSISNFLATSSEDTSIIRNSHFDYNGNSGLGGSGHYILIEDSVTNYNNLKKYHTGWHAGGVKFVGIGTHIRFIRHEANHNLGTGIWFDTISGGSIADMVDSQVEVVDSKAQHNTAEGIMFEASRGCTIRNNLTQGNAYRGIYISNSSDCKIYGNKMIGNQDVGLWIAGGRGRVLGPDADTPARNNRISCNLFIGNQAIDPTGYHTEMVIDSALNQPELFGNNTSDYNVFYDPAQLIPNLGTVLYRAPDALAYNIESWFSQTGNDEHSKISSVPAGICNDLR